MEYFSDQERGKTEESREDISDRVWYGISGYINSLIDQGGFGQDFPQNCDDSSSAIIGTNSVRFWEVCHAEIPKLPDDINTEKPETLDILDLIQFCFRCVCSLTKDEYHDYYRHHHLTFNRKDGQQAFLEQINRIFERNGIVYRLQPDGGIVRTLSPELGHLLDSARSGNETGFDDLLNDAKSKILNRDPRVRKEGLERLWDAWERLKTLEEGKDKEAQITNLLDKASSTQVFRQLLEEEARMLTRIGNAYQIRHHEQGKEEISDPRQIDYLFFRMLSMIVLLLRARSGSL
ncbi:AbiJ-NTD4 domain-containing protein [Candidatus Magnetaquiglobus chichijimensis]|uniref:AbiJ-NTD4 domain-containing protein n=1 Tax=Candidatus Magnetaquiglobus chichijimensis TaxID=3141448 RepID=UPI003B97501F